MPRKKVTEYSCSECQSKFTTLRGLKQHAKSVHEKSRNKADHEQRVANSRAKDYILKGMDIPLEIDYAALEEVYTEEVINKYGESSGIVLEYQRHSNSIFQSKTVVYNANKMAIRKCKNVQITFNIPIPPSLDPADERIKDILKVHYQMIIGRMRFQWKLSMHIGGIIEKENKEGCSNQFQYFSARNNFNVIKNDQDIPTPYLFQAKESAAEEFSNLISNLTLSQAVNRPDTKSVMAILTNIHIVIFETGVILDFQNALKVGNIIPMFPLEVDNFIRQKKSTYIPQQTEKLDCIWQCFEMILADGRTPSELEKHFKEFLSQHNRDCDDAVYGGLRLFKKLKFPKKERLDDCEVDIAALLEDCFEINLYVYTLTEEDIRDIMEDLKDEVVSERVTFTALPLYTSVQFKKNQKSVNLLLQWNEDGDGHCYLIKDIKQFFTQYRCQFCNALFRRRDHCQDHQKSRTCLSRFTYPGGTYERSKSIWEQCADLNIDFEEILGTDTPRFNHFITFDIEAAVDTEDHRTRNTEKEQVLGTHRLVSIAYKSNVPGMDGTKFVSIWQGLCEEEVFETFYNDACAIQKESEKLWHKQMQPIYSCIERRIILNGGQCKPTHDRLRNFPENVQQDFSYISKYHAKKKKKELTPEDELDYHMRFTRQGKCFLPDFPRSADIEHDMCNKSCKIFQQVLRSRDDIDQQFKSRTTESQVHNGFDEQKDYVKKLFFLLKELKKFGSILPIVAFNSSYDLSVCEIYWSKKCIRKGKGKQFMTRKEQRDALQDDTEDQDNEEFDGVSARDDGLGENRDNIVNVIKNTSRYKSVTTRDGLQFLDLLNYLPAGTSLDKAVCDYKVKDSKAVFPYSILASEDLAGIDISPSEATYDLFKDTLKAHVHRVSHNILEENWALYMKKHHTWTIQPIIWKLAEEMSAGEDFHDWLTFLGFHDPQHQKQKTLDLETFETDYLYLASCKEQSPLWKKARQPKTGFETFYKDFISVCKNRQFSNFLEYLEYYNSKDVEVMHPLIEKISDNFRGVSKTCELFRGNISLPHLARNIGYEFAEKAGASFHLAKGPKEGEELERKIRRNLAGGPSIIFNRHLQVGENIPGTSNPIQIIKTYDANALYSKCMQYRLPVGANVYLFEPDVNEDYEEWLSWKEERGKFVERQKQRKGWVYKRLGRAGQGSSAAEQAWIQYNNDQLHQVWAREKEAHEETGSPYISWDQCQIKTQRTNKNMPVRIGCGICPDGVRYRHQFTDFELKLYPEDVKGLVYEFLSDYYHGNVSTIERKQEQMDATDDTEERAEYEKDIQWLQQQHEKTIEKFHRIHDMGFVIKFTWEGDFRRYGLSKEEKKEILETEYPPFTCGYMKEPLKKRKDYLAQLSDPVKFMGLLMKDFDEKKIAIDEEQNIAFFGLAEVDISLPKERHPDHDSFPSLFVRGPILDDGEKGANLRGLFSAQKVVLITPYIQYLVSIGYTVTRVYRCWEYFAQPVLKPFIDRVVEERKKGDIEGGNPMLANAWKLVGNSFYGGSLMCKDKHSQVKYVDNFLELKQAINKPFFINYNIIDTNIIEIEEVAKKIKQNVPIQLGKWVLDHAKIRMAMFEHSILRKYCDPNKYALISMDTDSFTLALSGENIKDIVREEHYKYWISTVQDSWFVHEPCTKECRPEFCNKRVPGPMKEEYSGQKAVALSSKLFCVSNIIPGMVPKVACKGLKKKGVYFDPLVPMEETLYGKRCMQTEFGSLKRVPIIDNGMKIIRMATTHGSRQVSNVYKKRRLNADHVTTTTISGTAYCGTPTKERERRFLRKEFEEERLKINNVREKESADASDPSKNIMPTDVKRKQECPERDRSNDGYSVKKMKVL